MLSEKDKLKDRLECNDLSNLIAKKLKKAFIDQLEQLNSYKSKDNSKLRDSYRYIFQNIVQEWAGPNQEMLEQDLDLV